MFKKIAEAIVCGAIGAAALYVVGRIAYQAGQDVAREECRYEALHNENCEKKAKPIQNRVENDSECLNDPGTDLIVPDEVSTSVQRRKQSKLGLLFGAKRLFGNKKSMLGNLVKNPEDHKFEAYVEGDELQIHVKRREAS